MGVPLTNLGSGGGGGASPPGSIPVYKQFLGLHIRTNKFGLLTFYQLKLLLKLIGPTGPRKNYGDLQMMSKDPTHLYRKLSFSDFASIHASKPISKAC